VDDDQPLPSDAGRLADKMHGLDARVGKLECRFDELSANRRSSDNASAPVVVWQNLSPSNETEELEKLAKWVEWLQERYATAGDWLRPCWWRHGFVIEELAALRTAWTGVYESDEPPASTAALKWHEDAAKCRERIRRAISTGPGCTAVSHKSDQSITDDPRWSDEQSAMRGVLSESDDQDVEDGEGDKGTPSTRALLQVASSPT
jgi:hypothetical protein